MSVPAVSVATVRCCPSHDDWAVLHAHLAREFHDLQADHVFRELLRARDATDWMGLEVAEALEAAVMATRHQLRLRTGRLVDIARLDTERHAGHR